MVYSGNTIDEALAKAEAATGRPINELIYAVKDHKKGFFKSSEYLVEITGFKEPGKLEIVSGKLNYIAGDIMPVIAPGANISLTVNDKIISGQETIGAEDLVEIKPVNISAERKITIIISDDKLEAYADVSYVPEIIYGIKDASAANKLVVEAENLNETFPPKFSKQEIIDALKSKCIKWGFIHDNIEKAVNGGRHLVAEGTKCVPAEDDYIKYFFNLNPDKKPMESDGKVDYYNTGEIEFVNAGTLLAQKYDGHEGKPGCDIFGNVIMPEKRHQIKLLKGPGCTFSADKNSVISSVEGMPSIKGNAICVYPSYIINEDVSLKTGNIEFDGDVVIKGHVHEGMKVKSGNNITINGDAINADISSIGNIKISGNMIASNIKAGENQLNEIESIKYINACKDFMIRMCQWYSNSIHSASSHMKDNPGIILKIIFESKFKSFREIFEGAHSFFSKNPVKEDIAKMWDTLNNIFKLIESGKMTNIDILLNTLKIINEFVDSYNILLTPADISALYCQNSILNATNSVEIIGKGCYNTIITAENTVRLSGAPGVFRGGKIFAGKGIYVGEAGSSAGVSTVLKTTKEGTIEAQVAYPNTIIGIEEQLYKIEYPVRKLKAYLNKGELIVEKLKL